VDSKQGTVTIPKYQVDKTKQHTLNATSPTRRILRVAVRSDGLTGDRAESKGAGSGRPDWLVSVSPRATEFYSNEKRAFRISRHFWGSQKSGGADRRSG